MPFPIEDFVVNKHIPNATDATNQVVCIAPFDCKVVSIQARHRVASTSGTLNLVKAASAVALSAGTSLITATMSNAGTADTNVSGTIDTTIGTNAIPQDTAIGLVFAGTLTNLLDLDITIVLRQIRKTK